MPGQGKTYYGKGVKHRPKPVRGNVKGIKKGGIRRLARRAGIKRISNVLYEKVRVILQKYLRHVLRDAFIYRDHGSRKTVSISDVTSSLNKRGRNIYGYTS